MKLLNTVPIEQIGGYSYTCQCGDCHKVHTNEIIFRDNALDDIGAIAEKYAGRSAKVLIVYAPRAKAIALDLVHRLKEFETIAEELSFSRPDTVYAAKYIEMPEDINLIIAVGGGGIADTLKYAVTAKRRNLIIVPDKVCSDAFLSPVSVLYHNGFKEVFKVCPPQAIVADFNIITQLTDNEIASAFGNITAKKVSLLDWKISNIICNEKHCETINDLTLALVDECLESANRARRRERPALVKLAEMNIRSGLYMQLAASNRISGGGEVQTEHALELLFSHEERDLKDYGENLMICALLLARVYRLALKRDFTGLLLPPDNNMRADCITDYFGIDNAAATRKVRNLIDEETLKKRRHKLREFREELLNDSIDAEDKLLEAYKLFRRIYDDAGYSLQHYIDPADFKTVLPLAPDVSGRFTLLSFLKDMGLLDNYLT